jgi:hypothetical protein
VDLETHYTKVRNSQTIQYYYAFDENIFFSKFTDSLLIYFNVTILLCRNTLRKLSGRALGE